jgi:hypothetical protein
VRVGVVIAVVWLVVGIVASVQRGYFKSNNETCAKSGTVVVTVLAGPLNYVGVNPKLSCHLPQPSK